MVFCYHYKVHRLTHYLFPNRYFKHFTFFLPKPFCLSSSSLSGVHHHQELNLFCLSKHFLLIHRQLIYFVDVKEPSSSIALLMTSCWDCDLLACCACYWHIIKAADYLLASSITTVVRVVRSVVEDLESHWYLKPGACLVRVSSHSHDLMNCLHVLPSISVSDHQLHRLG